MTSTVQTALLIAVLGMAGIFVFMSIFYLLIKGLDKWFPYQEEKPKDEFLEEANDPDGE